MQQFIYKQFYHWPPGFEVLLFPLCGTWKDKTLKKKYLIHEFCATGKVKLNMFVSTDAFKIRKALHMQYTCTYLFKFSIYSSIQEYTCNKMARYGIGKYTFFNLPGSTCNVRWVTWSDKLPDN